MNAALTLFPNWREYRQQVQPGVVRWGRTLAMLALRTVLFAAGQIAIAALFWLTGSEQPWQQSIVWWPVSAILANLVNLYVLWRVNRQEGTRLFDLYKIQRPGVARDLLILLGVFVIAGPLGYLPNILLAQAFFGSAEVASNYMFHALPLWAAVVALFAFPITIALAEMPTYYGYVLPRLEALSGRPWLAIGLTGLVHAAQHMALPLIFNGPFLMWRLLMFMPFAYLMAVVLWRRPRLFPYTLIIHGLMDLSVSAIIFTMSM